MSNPEKPQSDKFRDLARELGCDEDEAAWDERLKQVAAHKPTGDEEAPPTPSR